MLSRVLLGAVPVLLVPLGFTAFVLASLTEAPATSIGLLGAAFACAVGTIICWWLLALERLVTAR